MSRDVQIIDVEYKRDDNTYKSYMLLTCLDTNNKHVYINVHNLTFKIYCAIDHGTTQDEVDELGRKLFDKLRDDNIYCRRTQCECKNEPPLDWVVPSEKYTQMCSFPCTKHLKKRYDVYLGSEVVYDYGFPVYEEIKRPFACFKFSDYEFCTQACKILNYLHTCKYLEEHLRGSYGLSLDPISEFYKAVNIYSYSWIRIPVDTDDITPDQIEPLLKDERMMKPNEFYCDIETLPPPGERVTIPTRDPVICISVLINTVPIVKKVFAWVTGPVAPGETEIVECHSEKELLTRFFAFVQDFVPDINIGFHHIKFDTRYLNIRARLLGISPLNTWVKNHRMRECMYETATNASKTVLSAAVYAPGVIYYDLCAVIKKVYPNFSMYNLSTCCKNILNEQVKHDLAYEKINDYHFGTPEQRRDLYEYNMADTVACYKLFQKTNALNLLKEGCSVYNCDVRSLLERGVSYFTSLLLLKRMATDYLWCSNKVNDIARPYTIVDGYQELSDNAKKGEKYSGAHVLNPVIGLLLYYIVVLDVKSMYPNIIRLGNICPSTLLPYRKEYKRKWPVDETTDFQGSTGHFFSRKRRGLLPAICEQLLEERDKVRKAQKKLDKKSVEWAILEARQLQLKVAANSAYGGCGTSYSLLSCFVAAICIPGFGKEILHTEVSFVYNMAKPGFGVEHQTQLLTELVPEAQQLLDNDPVVIYGDTDSIMVGFKKCTDIKIGVILGALMFKIINSLLGMPSTILVQHESDVIAMLLQGKKKYFYLKLEDGEYKEVFKGMEMVRRDYFPYLTRILKDLYSYMRNPDLSDPVKQPIILLEILEKTKKYLKDLFEGKVKNEELLMTCNISQRVEDYKNNLFQVNVAKQLQKAGIEVEPGTRVEFYYHQQSFGNKSENVIAAKLVDQKTFKPYYDRYFERMEATLERYLLLMVGEKCTEHVLNTCQYYSGQQTIFNSELRLTPKLADPIYPNNYDIGFEKEEENIEESFGLEMISKIKPKKSTKRKAKDPNLNNNKITDIFKKLKS